jgi:hypothetical protein
MHLMTPSARTTRRPLAALLRWSARVIGGLLVIMTLVMAVAYYIDGLQSDAGGPLRAFAFFLSIDFLFWGMGIVGLLIAYRYEGLGGGLALVSFGLRFLRDIIADGMTLKEGAVNDFVIFAIPAILYIASWKARKSTSREK